MLLTKFTHSCVRLEKDGTSLVIDPGSFSEVEEALEGTNLVLITHVHPDHYDAKRLAAALAGNPELTIYAPRSVIDELTEASGEAADRLHTVTADATLSLGPFEVRTFGGQHALIHPLIRTVDNVGYLVDDTVYHPGDSFVVPHDVTAPVLLAPLHAPWSRMAEVIDFVVSARPRRVFPVHDALLSDNGLGVVEKQVSAFAATYGVAYRRLVPGERVTL